MEHLLRIRLHHGTRSFSWQKSAQEEESQMSVKPEKVGCRLGVAWAVRHKLNLVYLFLVTISIDHVS